MTTPQSQPSNPSEWQLYRVLQKANLLQYYSTFVAQGGDDVQQLCEAGEEEFLEIMALVGMASKPLHVRRLQKSLQEWVANPAAFQNSNSSPTGPLSSARDHPSQVYSLPTCTNMDGAAAQPTWNTPTKCVSPSPASTARIASPSRNNVGATTLVTTPTVSSQKMASTSPQPTPALMEGQINTIAVCASDLAKKLPFFEAKHLSMKKDINREIQAVLQMPMDAPNRLELMRKYGCIYGRFDSKRKGDKPMSLHEISVNEASAQLCYHMANLLTRREDLFPLARQVVRDAGYHYSKGHSRATELNPENPSKRPKIENYINMLDACYAKAEGEKVRREERLSAITQELQAVSTQQQELVQQVDGLKETGGGERLDQLQQQLEIITSRHLRLLTEQSDILRKQSEANSVVSHWSSSLANSKSDASLNTGFFGDLQSEKDLEDSNLGSGSNSPTPNLGEDPPDIGPALQGGPSTTGNTSRPFELDSTLRAMLVEGLKLPVGQDSLFDEGLRIAQQYGMADFAQELKQLQGDNSPESVKSDTVITSGLCRSVHEDQSHEPSPVDNSYTKDGDGDERNGTGSDSDSDDVHVQAETVEDSCVSTGE